METLSRLGDEARAELVDHILPYWSERALDEVHGGFVGQIDGHDRLVPDAPKGGVLNARILWTFAAACRALETKHWCAEADRAYAYLRDHFRDPVHGGVFWSVTADGRPLDPKKQVYGQAFTVYALAEYARLTDDPEAVAWAREVYDLIETHAVDPVHEGYFEAFSRDWGPADDVRLSEKDEDAPKSMNTHLHVLEAYTTLYRVWPDAGLAERLRVLVRLFLDRIVDPVTGHMTCFFAEDWARTSSTVSFGHDIEASWLLDEAAAVLGDDALAEAVRAVTLSMARRTIEEGLDADGGLLNERGADGHLDDDKHWWPQAEAVVGFLNAYQHTGDAAFAEAALATWAFIQRTIVDREGGEWHFRVSRSGEPYRGEEDKVGPWKCPYHNARACLEIMERVGAPMSV